MGKHGDLKRIAKGNHRQGNIFEASTNNGEYEFKTLKCTSIPHIQGMGYPDYDSVTETLRRDKTVSGIEYSPKTGILSYFRFCRLSRSEYLNLVLKTLHANLRLKFTLSQRLESLCEDLGINIEDEKLLLDE